MTDRASSMAGVDARQIAARIERMPFSSWHWKAGAIISSAWFFDAADALAIAYVVPVLIGLWRLTPAQIGLLLAAGFIGQAIGSVAAGWLGERWGRIPTALLTLLVFSLMSIACAFAWDYPSMFWFRFVQGLGLGGEVPIMITYINEFSKAPGRGRYTLGVQLLFAFGLVAAALAGVWIVPNLGWQWMFYIGAVPALIAIPMRFVLPESARWLASKGRLEEADLVVRRIESVITEHDGKTLAPLPADLPPVPRADCHFGDLFRGIYLKRTLTVWCLWMTCYFCSYGIGTWLPSLYRSVFHLSLQQSLNYGFTQTAAALASGIFCTCVIDFTGRRPLFIVGLAGASLALLSFLVLDATAYNVMIRIVVLYFFLGLLLLALGMYTAEIYPNNMRALGSGVAAAWQRVAAAVGPLLVGGLLPGFGIAVVFVFFGCVMAFGFVVCVLYSIETRNKVLEQLSPSLPQKQPRAA